MQNYTLYDMIGLVKLGVWQGARVEGIGFVGGVSQCDVELENSDLFSGIYLSHDVIIIKNITNENAEVNLTLGIYQPYHEQGFQKFQMKVDVDSEQELIDRLISVVEGVARKIGLSDHVYTRSPFHYQRRYGTNYVNARSGSLSSTRRNR